MERLIRFKGSREDGVPVLGSGLFKKRRRLESPLSLPYEDSVREWLSASQEEGSPQTPNLAANLTSAFPASRTVKNKHLVFEPPSIWHFII